MVPGVTFQVSALTEFERQNSINRLLRLSRLWSTADTRVPLNETLYRPPGTASCGRMVM